MWEGDNMYPWKVIAYLFIPADQVPPGRNDLYWSLPAPTIEGMEPLLTSGDGDQQGPWYLNWNRK